MKQLRFRVQRLVVRRSHKAWQTLESCHREEAARAFAAAYQLDTDLAGQPFYPDLRIIQGNNIIAEWRDAKPLVQQPTLGDRLAAIEQRVGALERNPVLLEGR